MLEQASTALDLLSLTCTGHCERVCGHVICRPGRAETGVIVRRKQIVYGKAEGGRGNVSEHERRGTFPA